MICNSTRVMLTVGASALFLIQAACSPEQRAAETAQRADERIEAPAPAANPVSPPNQGSSAVQTPSEAAAEGPEGVVLTRSVAQGEVDLGIYVGHYPFHPVDDVSFMEHPLVDLAVRDAVADEHVRDLILTSEGPQTPVFVFNESGVSNLDEDLGAEARVAAWGCTEQSCDVQNWTVIMYRDGTEPEVCYHVEGQTQWLRPGQPPESVETPCPTDPNG